MTKLSSPRVPAYRITLFYGPELIEGQPAIIQCVFNVKKRSWKGGVQIVVEVDELQLLRIGESLGFEEWLAGILAQVPEAYRSESQARAKDLFAQQVCLTKLQQAILQGIRQENIKLDSRAFVQELDESTLQEAELLKHQVLEELDVEEIGSQEIL